MVHFEVTGGVDPLLTAHMQKGDKVLAEANAMVAMQDGLSLKGRSRGGLFKSLARKILNDETFFQLFIEADEADGDVLLAPKIPGDIMILDIGERQYMLSDGAFLASTDTVSLDVKSQGIGRALLGDSGGFFVMSTSGAGQVAVSGFGSIQELEVKLGHKLLVDNGHLVAWDASLDYELTINSSRSGLLGKLVNSQLTGEGILLKFKGEGKVYVCSRNKGGFIDWIFGERPTDKAAKNE